MRELRAAEIDAELEIGGEEIDAKKRRSRMTVEVAVNGDGPYRFIVDSGADSSVVGTRIADKLGLPAGTPTLLNTITDTQMVERVYLEELQLGPTVVRYLEVPVLREADLGADGMIGLDALIDRRLMLDFENRVITVDDARTRLPRMDNVIVVRARKFRDQLILTEIKVQGYRADAVIDTGSEITIGNHALLEKLQKRGWKNLPTVEVTGVTGTTLALKIAVLDKLSIGGVLLENVTIAFADIPPFDVFDLNDEPALLLGTDLMETFRKVSLDFSKRKVRFQLKGCDRRTTRLRSVGSRASRISGQGQAACS